jgi:hypothetical protein
MAKVTMHWYGFQMFTMRLVSSSGVLTQCQELKDSAEVLIAWGGAGAPG